MMVNWSDHLILVRRFVTYIRFAQLRKSRTRLATIQNQTHSPPRC